MSRLITLLSEAFSHALARSLIQTHTLSCIRTHKLSSTFDGAASQLAGSHLLFPNILQSLMRADIGVIENAL